MDGPGRARSRPVTGTRRREWHSGFKTKREAERAHVEILADLQRGVHIEPSELTFGRFLVERWLPAREHQLAPSTFESYAMNVRVHIAPGIGAAAEARPRDVLTRYYGERRASGLAPRTVRYIHSILRKSLADALTWGLVARNAADAASPPSNKAGKPSPPQTWSADELRMFLEAVRGERLAALWVADADWLEEQAAALGRAYNGLIEITHEARRTSPAPLEPDTICAGWTMFPMSNGTIIDLYAPQALPDYFDNGIVFGFRVDDIEAASAELAASGCELLGEITRPEEYSYSYRHFRGPDGRVYGINEQN